MIHFKRIFIFIILFLFTFHLNAQTVYSPVKVPHTNTTKGVFVHYMPWFESMDYSNYWGWHWTMNKCNPSVIVDAATGKRQIASRYYPLTGPYSSSDPDIIEYQLLLMKLSGADGVLIDWPGTRSLNDLPKNLSNSNALISKLSAVGLKFAIVYEDANRASGDVAGGKQDFTYMQTNYFNNGVYEWKNSAPLVLDFGPQIFKTPSEWTQILSVCSPKPKLLALSGQGTSMVGSSNMAGEYIWVYQSHLNAINDYNNRLANTWEISMGGVYPGFDGYYADAGIAGPTWKIAYNGTSTFDLLLDKAIATSTLEYIQMITWNDWGEGTMIEPSVEFGYSFLTSMQKKLGVAYTQTDLETVYELYKQRKKYKGNTTEQTRLTQVFYYLVSLQMDKAKALLGTTCTSNCGGGSYTYYLIRNKWQSNQYLYENNGKVSYGPLPANPGDAYKWTFVDAGTGYYNIQNLGSKNYMNIENYATKDYVECNAINPTFGSPKWTVEDAGNGYVRFKNSWQNTLYIHLENLKGYAEQGTINTSWESAQWMKEGVTVTSIGQSSITPQDQSVRIYPNPVTNGILTVEFPIENEWNSMQLFNMFGQQVMREDGLSGTVPIDVSKLSQGIYIVNIQNKNMSVNHKIMIR